MHGETEATREDGRGYPLLWAIEAFRDELEQLVEAQLALIAGQATVEDEPADRPSFATPPAPRAAFTSSAPSIPEPPAREEPAPPPRPRPRETFERSASPEWITPTTTTTPTPTTPRPPAPTASDAPAAGDGAPDDPRRRLDALAKLLDRRLKPSPEGTPTPAR